MILNEVKVNNKEVGTLPFEDVFMIYCYPVEYSEPYETSKMELFAKIVNGFQLFTIFAKSSILDI